MEPNEASPIIAPAFYLGAFSRYWWGNKKFEQRPISLWIEETEIVGHLEFVGHSSGKEGNM